MTAAADASGTTERERIRAAESRIEFAVAGAFTVLVAGTLIYVHELFRPLAPPVRLMSWTVFMGTVVALMFAVPLAVLIRRPSDAEIVRVWARAGKVVTLLFDLACASSVWLLLPYASETLRLLMVVFYAAVISGQVISAAESTELIVFAVVSILGGSALFFLLTPGPYSVALAVFLLAFGALMVGVSLALKVAMRSAIRARLQAEAVSGELAQALARETEAREGKQRFIAAATHDLRQPLQAAALFFDRHARSDDPAYRERTGASTRLAFEEAAGLLDQLLDHMRLDAGAVEAEPVELELGAMIARVAAEVAPVAEAAGVRLRPLPTRLRATGDVQMTARVLRNLLHNAVRHSRGRRVLVGARRRGDRVRVYVVDDGRGVSPADRAILFDEYRQGGGGRTGGMGLGLASARRMAELMGGSVGLDPRWLRGAAFWLELPRG